MSFIKKYNFRKILLAIFWSGITIACIVLLVAAVRQKTGKLCKGVEVNIEGATNNFFISKQDVMDIIKRSVRAEIVGQPVSRFNLVAIEKELKKYVWISKAELFFDNTGILQAEIEERVPIVRVFTKEGESFYVDNVSTVLPLSDKYAARLPVFTNFPSHPKAMNRLDSLLLKDIKQLGLTIQKDSFLMAMIDQVDITEARLFEMVPKMGDQLILFGDAKDADNKFNKLKLFYKKVIPIEGWNKYSYINLQYKEQVVAKIKGMEDVVADSLQTIRMLQAIATHSSAMAGDTTRTITQDDDKNSTNISLILQSLQREEASDSGAIPAPSVQAVKVAAPKDKPVVKNEKNNKINNAKPVVKNKLPSKPTQQPAQHSLPKIQKSKNNHTNEY